MKKFKEICHAFALLALAVFGGILFSCRDALPPAVENGKAIDNQPETGLRRGDFCAAYGIEILCFLLAAGTLMYTKIT